MADVNWRKYDCDICLAVSLIGAAVASALAVYVLGAMGLGVVLQVILFLIVWAVLGWVADGLCAARTAAGSVSEAPVAVDVADEDARLEKADAEAEAAEAAEAAARAEADAKASEQEAALKAAEAKAAEEAEARKAAAAAEIATKEAEETSAVEAAARKAAEDKAAAERTVQQEVGVKAVADDVDRDGDGIVEGSDEGKRPEALDGPRDGKADDLKKIKGIGPKLEQLCNSLGFYHFDQIAGWTSDEVAWVDSNLEGFKGRVTRDEWVAQATLLSTGGETEFSKRVDEGDVPSSQ